MSYTSQKEFSDQANQKGIPIKFIITKGAGNQHHGTSAQGIRTGARCLEGLDDNEIAAKVAEHATAVFSTPEKATPN